MLERLTPGKGMLLNLGTGRGHSVRQVVDVCRRVARFRCASPRAARATQPSSWPTRRWRDGFWTGSRAIRNSSKSSRRHGAGTARTRKASRHRIRRFFLRRDKRVCWRMGECRFVRGGAGESRPIFLDARSRPSQNALLVAASASQGWLRARDRAGGTLSIFSFCSSRPRGPRR